MSSARRNVVRGVATRFRAGESSPGKSHSTASERTNLGIGEGASLVEVIRNFILGESFGQVGDPWQVVS
jgi:hypothetical protein